MPSPELIWSLVSSENEQPKNYLNLIAKRMEAGKQLYESNHVQKISDALYIVKSASDESVFYTVEGENCNCKDHISRGKSFLCKHRNAVKFFEET